MSRRSQIAMSAEEVEEFLRERHTLDVATIGPSGSIHLVAMWYGFLDRDIAFWTYRKSQKVLNLRRDPRMTCLVETGDTYDQLRGVELVGRGEIIEDRDTVMRIGESVSERYTGPVNDQVRAGIEVIGAKRVGVRVRVDSVVSWDHRKLGGAY